MNAPSERHLEWRNFRELIEQGVPAIQRVSGNPHVYVFVDEGGTRIGMRAPNDAAGDLAPSPIAEIEIREVTIAKARHLEIATHATNLFAEFYALLEEIADRIQLRAEPPTQALASTLANWKALLRPADRMSDEQRIGLFGELLVLERLIRSKGPDAVGAWTGPLGEPHDFRFEAHELEVKTTTTRRRSHLISSLEQLEPSPNKALRLVSIQLEPTGPGAGLSLPELVDEIRSEVAVGSPRRDQLEEALLVGWRFSDVHARSYVERFSLRAPTRMMLIDATFPRITPGFVQGLPGSDRLSDIQYRVDVHDLGVPDGDEEFVSILPGLMAI